MRRLKKGSVSSEEMLSEERQVRTSEDMSERRGELEVWRATQGTVFWTGNEAPSVQNRVEMIRRRDPRQLQTLETFENEGFSTNFVSYTLQNRVRGTPVWDRFE